MFGSTWRVIMYHSQSPRNPHLSQFSRIRSPSFMLARYSNNPQNNYACENCDMPCWTFKYLYLAPELLEYYKVMTDFLKKNPKNPKITHLASRLFYKNQKYAPEVLNGTFFVTALKV